MSAKTQRVQSYSIDVSTPTTFNANAQSYGHPQEALCVIDWMLIRFFNGAFDDNLTVDLTMNGHSVPIIGMAITLASGAADTLFIPFHSGLPLWKTENDTQGSSVPPALATNNCQLGLGAGNVGNTNAAADIVIGFHFETPAHRH